MNNKKILPIIVLAIYFVIGLWKLNDLPGEWYGDISNVHEYVLEILNGLWPWYFFQSTGPIYHYLVTPVILLLGSNYWQYKFSSVLVGGMGVVMTYLAVKELADRKTALWAMFLAAVSFWTIVWARTGNSQIIILFLTANVIFWAEKYAKTRKPAHLAVGALSASLGLFEYPQTFVLPLLWLWWLVSRKQIKGGLLGTLLLILPLLLFAKVILSNLDNFTTGYVGDKVPSISQLLTQQTRQRFIENIKKTALMMHYKGEGIFRVNVPGDPHIDRISGIFFLLGILYLLKTNRPLLVRATAAMFLLALPSMSPAIPPGEIPNSGRTMGIVPLVYFLTATGISESFNYLKRYSKKTAGVATGIVLTGIILLNLYKYFVLYPPGLPDQNRAYAKIMAEYVNTLPGHTSVYLSSCCWGNWGQPEPKALFYRLNEQDGRENLINAGVFARSCDDIKPQRPAIILNSPQDLEAIENWRNCFPRGEVKTHQAGGKQVFVSVFLGQDKIPESKQPQ